MSDGEEEDQVDAPKWPRPKGVSCYETRDAQEDAARQASLRGWWMTEEVCLRQAAATAIFGWELGEAPQATPHCRDR